MKIMWLGGRTTSQRDVQRLGCTQSRAGGKFWYIRTNIFDSTELSGCLVMEHSPMSTEAGARKLYDEFIQDGYTPIPSYDPFNLDPRRLP